jgi:hypothetical protein
MYWKSGEYAQALNTTEKNDESSEKTASKIEDQSSDLGKKRSPEGIRSRSMATSIDDSEQEEKYDTKRLHTVEKVDVGDYISLDLDDYYHARVEPKELTTIELDIMGTVETHDAVRLEVNSGGGLFYGGYQTEKTSTNEFLVPKIENQEEERAVYAFANTEDHTTFTSIVVSHVNKVGREIEIRATLLRVIEKE